VLPELLYERVGEVVERVGAHGELLTPLDEASAVIHLQEAYDAGIRSVAVVFMHGYRYDSHERRVAELAKQMGFTQVCTCVKTRPWRGFSLRCGEQYAQLVDFQSWTCVRPSGFDCR
jgi:5-oxoprolinase (ATP-hydrolysing)